MQYVVDNQALQIKMIKKNINSVSQLAEITGINRNTLAQVINDGEFPSSKVICALIEPLDISNDEVGGIFFVPKLT